MNLDSTSTKVHPDATRALKKTVATLFIKSQVSTITQDSFVCLKDRTMFLLSPGQLHSALPGLAQFSHSKLKEQGFDEWKYDKNVYQLCDEVARLLCRLSDLSPSSNHRLGRVALAGPKSIFCDGSKRAAEVVLFCDLCPVRLQIGDKARLKPSCSVPKW